VIAGKEKNAFSIELRRTNKLKRHANGSTAAFNGLLMCGLFYESTAFPWMKIARRLVSRCCIYSGIVLASARRV
jgi:hypothetical protein